MSDLESALVDHMHGLRLASLPATTVSNAKSLVMDTLGATITAVGHESVAPVAAMVREWGGRPDARPVGSNTPILAQHAALINGTMARALELDDVHEPAMLHATATIVPVALAAAELAGGVSGAVFLEAVIGGIDIAARLSLATLPVIPQSTPRTMSLTYQSGILAGTLAAARVMGLDKTAMRNALGVAYSQCAGNQQALYEGVDTVRVQQGLSAMTAMTSLQLAMAGVSGVQHALSGAAGYFSAFHGGKYDRDVLLGELGVRLEVDNVSVKPFPCCKYNHTAIAAAQQARRHMRFDLARIRRVVAHVNSREYFAIVCEPQDSAQRRAELASANGRVRAQFSLPLMVATALRFGGVEVHHLDADHRLDEITLALADKVETIIDPAFLEEGARHQMPVLGILDIYLHDDDAPISCRCDIPPGHPDNRMSFAEIVAKYACFSQPSRFVRGDTVPGLVAELEALPDVRQLLGALELRPVS